MPRLGPGGRLLLDSVRFGADEHARRRAEKMEMFRRLGEGMEREQERQRLAAQQAAGGSVLAALQSGGQPGPEALAGLSPQMQAGMVTFLNQQAQRQQQGEQFGQSFGLNERRLEMAEEMQGWTIERLQQNMDLALRDADRADRDLENRIKRGENADSLAIITQRSNAANAKQRLALTGRELAIREGLAPLQAERLGLEISRMRFQSFADLQNHVSRRVDELRRRKREDVRDEREGILFDEGVEDRKTRRKRDDIRFDREEKLFEREATKFDKDMDLMDAELERIRSQTVTRDDRDRAARAQAIQGSLRDLRRYRQKLFLGLTEAPGRRPRSAQQVLMMEEELERVDSAITVMLADAKRISDPKFQEGLDRLLELAERAGVDPAGEADNQE